MGMAGGGWAGWQAKSGPAFVVGNHGNIFQTQDDKWVTRGAVAPATTLTDVWGQDGHTLTAVGVRGTVLERRAGEWKKVPLATDEHLNAVTGVGEVAVAVGSSGVVFARRSRSWKRVTVLADKARKESDLYDVHMLDGQRFMAVGALGTVLACDLSGCKRLESPLDGELRAVWGRAPNDVFSGSAGIVAHYDGKSWSTLAPLPSKPITALLARLPHSLLAATREGLFEWNGARWSRLSGKDNWLGASRLWKTSKGEIYGLMEGPSVLRALINEVWQEVPLKLHGYGMNGTHLTSGWSTSKEMILVGSGGAIVTKQL